MGLWVINRATGEIVLGVTLHWICWCFTKYVHCVLCTRHSLMVSLHKSPPPKNETYKYDVAYTSLGYSLVQRFVKRIGVVITSRWNVAISNIEWFGLDWSNRRKGASFRFLDQILLPASEYRGRGGDRLPVVCGLRSIDSSSVPVSDVRRFNFETLKKILTLSPTKRLFHKKSFLRNFKLVPTLIILKSCIFLGWDWSSLMRKLRSEQKVL